MVPLARTITVSLNMSNTFDTINIHTLIRKLLPTKIPGTIIKFIANYIKGLKVYATYRHHITIQHDIKTGVPQSDVVSVAVFNIYTAYLPPPRVPVQDMVYADDRNSHHHIHKHECSKEIHTYVKFLPGQNNTISH